MSSSRRRFLGTVAGAFIGAELWGLWPAAAVTGGDEAEWDKGIEITKGYVVLDRDTQRTMEAAAEALVPGSRALGIRRAFMAIMRNDPGTAGFLDAGLWNLEAVSRALTKKSFHELKDREEIDKVLNHVARHNIIFLKKFRDTVIQLHYSNPAVWRTLGYEGPPQPRGFMDYASPPRKVKG